MDCIDYNDLPDIGPYMRDMEEQGYYHQVRYGDMRHVEHAIVELADLSQGSGAQYREQSNADNAEDDICVLDALSQKSGYDEKVHIKDCMQPEKEKDDTPKYLVRGF
jgi:hypothetical protein